VGPRREGFTLVETVLALSLAGLFAFGCAVTIPGIIPGLHLRSGVWEVTSGLNQARFRAILSGAPVRVRFSSHGFAFERYDGSSGTWRTAGSVALPGVVVEANNTPTFHPQGTVTGLASIRVENARGAYRITVAITGRIRTIRTG
jgi:Tfp pilus assembly protein FimT